MNQNHPVQQSTFKKTTILGMFALLVLAACLPTTDEATVLTTQDESAAEPVQTETVARPTGTATPTMGPVETEAPPSPQPTTIEFATVVEPTETTPPTEAAPRLHPPDSRTGNAPLDAVIDAILAHDITARRELIRLTVVGCTHAEGMGGPPMCREDEAEGTLLEVFPILGAEGQHMRVENLDRALSFQVEGLYAVFEFSDDMFDAADYPAGEVGLLFLRSGEPFPLIVHVADGAIVRLDSYIDNTLDNVLGRYAKRIILPPPD
jgi:hypothetical protein